MRPLTQHERDIVSQLASRLAPEPKAQLLADLTLATAETAAADGSRILFDIPGYARPEHRGQHPFGAEGKLLDRDGTEISVVLYGDQNDRLLELEFIRWGDGDLEEPAWDSFVVNEPL